MIVTILLAIVIFVGLMTALPVVIWIGEQAYGILLFLFVIFGRKGGIWVLSLYLSLAVLAYYLATLVYHHLK